MDDYKWYCPYCDEFLNDDEVTFEEMHDRRSGGCGHPVQTEPDPEAAKVES